mgnify:FL=1
MTSAASGCYCWITVEVKGCCSGLSTTRTIAIVATATVSLHCSIVSIDSTTILLSPAIIEQHVTLLSAITTTYGISNTSAIYLLNTISGTSCLFLG